MQRKIHGFITMNKEDLSHTDVMGCWGEFWDSQDACESRALELSELIGDPDFKAVKATLIIESND